MTRSDDLAQLLATLDLTEYERDALMHLLSLGRTTAPNLSEATGIPKARIYGVLDSLADQGFVKIIPQRPKQYVPKSPDEILDRATENRRQQFESYQQSVEDVRDEFLSAFGPLYEQATDETSPTEELFYVVDVGDASETETRSLYREATNQINILTKGFEYLPNVRSTLTKVADTGIEINVLMVHPKHLSPENCTVQRERVEEVVAELHGVTIRFSKEPLPWRGTIIDPSMDYQHGKAILLVEEKDIPLHMRQAAVTENGSFVAGLQRYFSLIWKYESVSESPH
ncbi:TrmB family transcriptional regulator [Haloferax sp. MBLA0076]|uniref:TrmB family transcriptional regulator n=1 Tax=Haloferax litoreum TaxID=2666140 RepID=A0A6A8GI15_9EURY|nr:MULTISPECIES: helix-turn-helix domain-containing protein [Haloferax]KAB1193268.1 TrmB family transcriptional regulator [Haloferax sp. CBA1148]MRX21767.1 TrmB family transcriptional regulator [Haloferax litoreum]